jgi:uncharacterized membrane protein YgcG
MMTKAMLLAGLGCLLVAGKARATTCVNDVDCPGNAACGGDVCDYSTGTPTCMPAGTGTKGMDGWCTMTSDCKCASLGATCTSNLVFCTFTKPSDAPDAGGGGGSTGSDGGGGSTSSGGGGGGCSVAGSVPLGGSLVLGGLGLALTLTRRRARRRR